MGRRRRRNPSSGAMARHYPDKSARFLMGRVCSYAERILARSPSMDTDFLEFAHWLLGPETLGSSLDFLVRELCVSRWEDLDADLPEMLWESREYSHYFARFVRRNGRSLEFKAARFIRGLLQKRSRDLRTRDESDFQKKLSRLESMFHLNPVELELVVFLFCISAWHEVESFLQGHLNANFYVGRHHGATALGISIVDYTSAMTEKLVDMGIVDWDAEVATLEPSFVKLFQSPRTKDITTEFYQEINPISVQHHVPSIEPAMTEYLLDLLASQSDSPTHCLLYGPPGTGKTTYAHMLADKSELLFYAVRHDQSGKSVNRRSAFTAAVQMASRNGKALLIADDSDLVLNTRNAWTLFGEANYDRKWLNSLLEIPGVRMLWIVNDISNTEESVTRRFAMSLEFKPFGREARRALWTSILQAKGLEKAFTEEQMSELSRRYQCSAGQIDVAVQTAAKVYSKSPEKLIWAVNKNLESSLSVVYGGMIPRPSTTIDQDYCLEALNIADCDVNELLDDLEAFDRKLRSEEQGSVRSLNLIFYGPSGTGKSQFARYIAHHLDREAIVIRGSDIYSKWLGETESRIRDAFRRASVQDNSVLIFDEADSLVANRAISYQMYASFTNEFLQHMDEFHGIAIYTTNRLEDVDDAMYRRALYKLKFDWLDTKGRLALYELMLAPLCRKPMGESAKAELATMEQVTPGDFQNVRDRYSMRSGIEVSHRVLCKALLDETGMRSLSSGQKQIGF
ncbi:AAA family ATPase [Thermodesulfobacteriota bacterium]